MTEIINEFELEIQARGVIGKHGQEWVTEAVEAKQRNYKSNEVLVFLSHKHDDKEFIEYAIAILNNLGVEVYVDWLDSEMPKRTNGYTARKIKNKIKQCKKFILLATEDAIASKWCNWELGFGDAVKYRTDEILIFPIKKDNSNFTGSEYLAIYPHIEVNLSSMFDDLKWKVKYPESDETEFLKTWLKK